MKKLLLLLVCLLLACPALAEPAPTAGPLPVAEPLSGVACWPDGSDEQTARYVYRYDYPRAAGTDDVSVMINTYYEYIVNDAVGFGVPIMGESLEPSEIQSTTTVHSEITCNNDRYFSIKIVTENILGAAAAVTYSGNTFARTGAKAGTIISLPYLLGILDEEESDPWMQERQTAKADECVRNLVWEIIAEQQASGTVAYYDDLTYDDFVADFYPEEDFYLDADGNPVFFVQESILAPAAEGTLLFPFTMEELLDEI